MDNKKRLLQTALLMAVVGFSVTIPVALCYDYLWLGRSPEASFEHWSNAALGIPVGMFIGVLLGGVIRRRRVAKMSQAPGIDPAA